MDDEKNTVRQQKCTFIVSFAREKRKRIPLLCFIFVHYRTCSYFVEIRMELKGQQNTVKSSLHSRHIYIGSLLCVRKSFFLPACLLLLLLMLLMLVLMKSRWALNKVCIIVTDSATEEVTISKILISEYLISKCPKHLKVFTLRQESVQRTWMAKKSYNNHKHIMHVYFVCVGFYGINCI